MRRPVTRAARHTTKARTDSEYVTQQALIVPFAAPIVPFVAPICVAAVPCVIIPNQKEQTHVSGHQPSVTI